MKKIKSFPVRAIKAYRAFVTSTVLEGKGQLHPAVAVSPGRGPVPMKCEIVCDPRGSASFEKSNFVPLPAVYHLIITITTTLPRLSINNFTLTYLFPTGWLIVNCLGTTPPAAPTTCAHIPHPDNIRTSH